MAYTANRAGPPRPSTTTRLLERKRVQRRPLPNRKDQNRGCGPWEAGGLPAAPRAASPGRLPGVSWCRDGQPAGQEGRLMRGASHPPTPPGHPLSARTKAAGPTPRGVLGPPPARPLPDGSPSPTLGPSPPSTSRGRGPSQGSRPGLPGRPCQPGRAPPPGPTLICTGSVPAWPPGHYCHQTGGGRRALAPGSLGAAWTCSRPRPARCAPPTPVLRPSHLRPLPRASTSHPVRGSSALRPGADGRAWSLSPALASGGTPKGSSRCSVAR